MKEYDIAILGGGASGLMAANLLANSHFKTCIIEKNEILGRKLLSTGNGRCNFSNKKQGCQYYNCQDPAFVTSILNKFSTDDICDYLISLGLLTRDVDGYMYPYSNQAYSLVDAMTRQIDAEPILKSQVKSVEENGFNYKITYLDLSSGKKNTIYAKKVIFSLGGKAAPMLGTNGDAYYILSKLGVDISQIYPALCPIKSKDVTSTLSKIRCQAALSIVVDDDTYCQSGEIQFNNGIISGIPAFCLSRYVSSNSIDDVEAYIDFFPDYDNNYLIDLITSMISKASLDTPIIQCLSTLTNKNVVTYILERLDLLNVSVSDFDDLCIKKFTSSLKHTSFVIDGTLDFDKSQVTAGGVYVSQLDEFCQLKSHNGIYILGETIDVDGICGGYNISFAFATAKAACLHILEAN